MDGPGGYGSDTDFYFDNCIEYSYTGDNNVTHFWNYGK
jgi:hypothetical protein